MLAIIGGSGLYQLPGLIGTQSRRVQTRWGEPSDEVVSGRLNDCPVLFLPRHARSHSIAPHRINYRANIAALKECGASRIIAVAAVGGIAADCPSGALVVPDQLIDYTTGRDGTYFDVPGEAVTHVDFTHPYDPTLRTWILQGALSLGLELVDSGVYGCTNGPRLETAAEISRMHKDGCTVVGMTGMPEAALARELGLPYACLALVVNPAAGVAPGGQVISMEEIRQTLDQGIGDVCRLLAQVCRAASSSVSNSSSERA